MSSNSILPPVHPCACSSKFEVDNAKCSDGRTYDLDFDASFKLLKEDIED